MNGMGRSQIVLMGTSRELRQNSTIGKQWLEAV